MYDTREVISSSVHVLALSGNGTEWMEGGGDRGWRGSVVSTTPRHCSSIHHTDSTDYYYSATNAYLRILFIKNRAGLEKGFC